MSESDKRACALLINDIHVSSNTIADFLLNWEEALLVCKKYDIPSIYIGGDLWQKRAHQTLDVLMAVRKAILRATSLGIELTIAEGNHDLVDQEEIEGYSHLFSEYPHVYVVDDFAFFDLSNKVELCVMSYFPENGSFPDRLKEAEENMTPGAMSILYIHQGINGALATPSETDLPASMFKEWDKVLVGHYHDRCKIKNTNIEYIGSSRQHNFGEAPEKGYTILYSDGSHEFVQNLVNTTYKTLEIDGDTAIDAAGIKKILDSEASQNCKVKLKINCTSEQAAKIDKQTLLVDGASKVEITTEQTQVAVENHDFDSKFDKEGIKKEYVSFCDTKTVDASMGLNYLDKITGVCGN